MTKKFIFYQWKIKEGREQIASLVNRIAVIFSLIVALVMFLFDVEDLIHCLMTFLWVYILVAYIGLGFTKAYKIKRFKGHLVLRWILFVLVAIYMLSSLVLFIVEKPEEGYVYYFVWEVCLAIGALQCLRNGYVN